MATHDYIISNGTGAAVRADLNNALAAIVSNNSNSSEPATKYAYQWWADTSNAVMKIRNSANDGWIELFQLDGTITLEDGSASTPALANRGDLDTGVFFGGANEFNIATAGEERFVINANGRCGIGATDASTAQLVVYRQTVNSGNPVLEVRSNHDTTNSVKFSIDGDGEAFFSDRVGFGNTSPNAVVTISESTTLTGGDINVNARGLVIDNSGGNTGLTFKTPNSAQSRIAFGDPEDNNIGQIRYTHAENNMLFHVNASERLRIQSGGGISFNGDTATANALDDYEKGTWTPTVGGVFGETFTIQKGTYVKIGDQFTAWFSIEFNAATSGSGDIVINSPFTMLTSNNHKAGGMIIRHDLQNPSSSNTFAAFQKTSTSVEFYAGNTLFNCTNGTVQNGRFIFGFFTARTA